MRWRHHHGAVLEVVQGATETSPPKVTRYVPPRGTWNAVSPETSLTPPKRKMALPVSSVCVELTTKGRHHLVLHHHRESFLGDGEALRNGASRPAPVGNPKHRVCIVDGYLRNLGVEHPQGPRSHHHRGVGRRHGREDLHRGEEMEAEEADQPVGLAARLAEVDVAPVLMLQPLPVPEPAMTCHATVSWRLSRSRAEMFLRYCIVK